VCIRGLNFHSRGRTGPFRRESSKLGSFCKNGDRPTGTRSCPPESNGFVLRIPKTPPRIIQRTQWVLTTLLASIFIPRTNGLLPGGRAPNWVRFVKTAIDPPGPAAACPNRMASFFRAHLSAVPPLPPTLFTAGELCHHVSIRFLVLCAEAS
jgi:hypothetical protein